MKGCNLIKIAAFAFYNLVQSWQTLSPYILASSRCLWLVLVVFRKTFDVLSELVFSFMLKKNTPKHG